MVTVSRRRPPAPLLTLAAVAVAVAVVLPLVFLVVQAKDAGWEEVHRVLDRPLPMTLLRNTVELALSVGLGTAVLGTAAAWCTERTQLPGRRLWAVLVVLPVAIPDFVVGWAWHSIAPRQVGLHAATWIMTLDLYPLVYLPVAAALRRSDPALEEAARSLGCGPWTTFRRVTLPQVRPALLGGVLVVVLALLAEYGAFEILRFRTFTTEVFTELHVDRAAASALALILVLLAMVVLTGEAFLGRGRLTTTAAPRPPARVALKGWTLPTLAGLTALTVAALGVPIGTLVYWCQSGQSTTLPSRTTLVDATLATAKYSSLAALLATIAALPVAILAVHRRSVVSLLLERSTFLIQSMPGVVVALSLVFFSTRWFFSIYQTGTLLVVSYALLFFPLALICVRSSVAQSPHRLTEVGRSLGQRPLQVLRRVTLPLVAPGLAAAFCLVFLSAVTELTATLVLIPTGQHTLVTEFWAFQRSSSYGAAAPYAAVIVAVAAVPSVALGQWFDRRRSQ